MHCYYVCIVIIIIIITIIIIIIGIIIMIIAVVEESSQECSQSMYSFTSSRASFTWSSTQYIEACSWPILKGKSACCNETIFLSEMSWHVNWNVQYMYCDVLVHCTCTCTCTCTCVLVS